MAINLLNIEEYIIQRITEVAPDINTGTGSAIRDLLVSPMITVLQPLANEIHRVKKTQSLLNSSDLSDEDLDAILANIFIDRLVGSKARGIAKIFLSTAQIITIPAGTLFFAAGGLKFYSTQNITRGPATLSLNLITGRYEIEIEVEAAQQGSEYNISEQQITGIVSANSVIVGASNDTAFLGGSVRESSEDLVDRARAGLGSRDLSTKRGALAILQQRFAEILDVNVIGFGNKEMVRDTIFAPNLTIDGVEYGISDAVHIGGKVDIYIRVGKTIESAIKPNLNSGSSTYGLNRLAFYTGGTNPNIKYEEIDTDCALTDTPLIGIRAITLDSSSSDLEGFESVSLEEGKNIVFFTPSPGLNNSMDEKKELRFIKGSGVIDNVILNYQYNNNFSGYYFALNNYSYTTYLGVADFRGRAGLEFEGVSSEDLDIIDIFNNPSTDGGGSLAFKPSHGQGEMTNVDGLTYTSRIMHLGTGHGSFLTDSLNNSRFTLMGWFNISSLSTRNTLFNSYDNADHVLDIYIDESGYIHYNTISGAGGAQDNRTADPVLAEYVDVYNSHDNWVFLAFTYDRSANAKQIFYANIHDVELKMPVWDTQTYNISTLNLMTNITIGTTKDFENNIDRTFNGLMDAIQIYDQDVLDYSQIESIRKNQNTLTIDGIENTTIPGQLATSLATYPTTFTLAGGRIFMVNGFSAGAYYDIVSSDISRDSENVVQSISIRITGTGGTPVSRIRTGDTYALTPKHFTLPSNVKVMEDLINNLTTSMYLTEEGEQKIGVGVEVVYEAGLGVPEAHTYVTMHDTRPANADLLVKHAIPIKVSGTIYVPVEVGITEEEIRLAFGDYAKVVPTGGSFNVIDALNYVADYGVVGVSLPLSGLVFTSRDTHFSPSYRLGIDDFIIANENQYFVVDSQFKVIFT